MRVLLLTHRLPFPPDKGDKIRAFHFLRVLARKHEVDVAALADVREDLAPARHARVREHCRRLDVAWRPRNRARMAALLCAVPGGRAASLPFFFDPRLARTVGARLLAGEYDAVIAHSAPMARYVPPEARVRRIADLCDVDSEKWREYASRAPAPSRWVYAREAFHLRRWESRLAREWDAVVVASEPEARIFRAFCPDGRLEVITNGVDAEFFAPTGARRDEATAIFTGAMDYPPNAAGVLWLHREVWPRVRARVPGARLVVVGPRPPDAVRALDGRDGVRVTGFVPDLRAELARATIAVAPLAIARGIQNKVLEALAAGLPVVATPSAAEGVAAQPGIDLLVASGAGPFAEAIVELFQDADRRATLSVNGRTAVVAGHSWERHGAALEALLHTTGAEAARAAGHGASAPEAPASARKAS